MQYSLLLRECMSERLGWKQPWPVPLPEKVQREKRNKVRDTKLDGQEEEGRGGGGRRLYLDKLIISHLQSAPTGAPSLHQAARCEDGAGERCRPVRRFPIISLAEGSVLPIHQRRWTRRALTAIRQPLFSSAEARSRR